MKTRIGFVAAGLGWAAFLMAQTPLQQEIQDRLKAVATALEQQTAGSFQLVWNNFETIPLAWVAPMVGGHPYSAVAREVTLSPDGAHVDRSRTETIYRDEQGRTRRETDGGKNISILDPAAGIAYDLDSERKVAMKRALAPATIARQSTAPSQSPLEIATAQAKGRTNMSVEDLGTQVVNGVSAQGVRVITVIPVGAIGNDRELTTVVDRWVSSDLHVLVKSVSTDSRSGAIHYDLTNLTLGPPDGSLFQVPAGYTIQEGPAGRGRGTITTSPAQPPRK